jgi:hypothetical protein
LDECAECRGELALTRLLQQGVRQVVQPAAPQAFKLRVMRALDDAPASAAEGAGDPEFVRSRLKVNRWTVAMSVAAALMLAVGIGVRGNDGASRGAEASMDVLGDIVARHVDQLPADIANKPPEQVTTWLGSKVGFRVRPVVFAEPQVHFLGARVSQVAARQAAMLYYSVGDSRLTTVVFQPPPSFQRVLHDDDLVASWGAHRQRFGNRLVTYRSTRGYTVPVFEQDGIAYAFAGDLDQHRLLQLVASTRVP